MDSGVLPAGPKDCRANCWESSVPESRLNPGHPLPQSLEAGPEAVSERLFY